MALSIYPLTVLVNMNASHFILRPQLEAAIRESVEPYARQYAVVVGLRGVGKSVAVQHALQNRSGVIYMAPEKPSDILPLICETLGIAIKKNTAELATVLRAATEATGIMPVIVVEHGTTETGLKDVARPLKELCVDYNVARCLLVLSDANAVYGLPNDRARQLLIWVDGFSRKEAEGYFDKWAFLPVCLDNDHLLGHYASVTTTATTTTTTVTATTPTTATASTPTTTTATATVAPTATTTTTSTTLATIWESNSNLRTFFFEQVGHRPVDLQVLIILLQKQCGSTGLNYNSVCKDNTTVFDKIKIFIAVRKKDAFLLLADWLSRKHNVAEASDLRFQCLVSMLLNSTDNVVDDIRTKSFLASPADASIVIKEFLAIQYHLRSRTYRFASVTHRHAAEEWRRQHPELDQACDKLKHQTL